LKVDGNLVFKDVWSGMQIKGSSDSTLTIQAHGVVLLRSELVH
jgi:hypothetical protein